MKQRDKIIYWISTLWLALGMTSTGIVQLLKMEAQRAVAPPGVYGIKYLGYPVYFLTILGVWKILGVVAVLTPKFPLVKEWAYARMKHGFLPGIDKSALYLSNRNMI